MDQIWVSCTAGRLSYRLPGKPESGAFWSGYLMSGLPRAVTTFVCGQNDNMGRSPLLSQFTWLRFTAYMVQAPLGLTFVQGKNPQVSALQ